jgi:ATP-dependent helicase/nuclease subunit A
MDAPDDDLPPDDLSAFQFARDCLRDLARRAGRMRIAEVLREALDRTGYLATLVGLPDGQRRRMNAEKLVSLAEDGRYLALSDFTATITDLSDRETRESQALIGDTKAVKLMTVHASKGLEFPMVVLANIQHPPSNKSSDKILMNDDGLLISEVPDDERKTSLFAQQKEIVGGREKAEKRRLFYVAATRAQDYLVMTSKIPGNTISQESWLGKLRTVLGFDQKELQKGYQQSYTINDQPVRLTVEAITPPEPAPATDSAWQSDAIVTGQPLAGEAAAPPLTQPVRVNRAALTRHLTATQIAHLGSSAAGSAYHRQALRRSLGQDVPGHIEQVSRYSADPVQKRIIGEMVHRVLSQPALPEGNALETMLQNYAWQLGILEERLRDNAVEQAKHDLDKFKTSEIYKEIGLAPEIYRELPFIFRTDKRILHGVLDVLFQREDGSWVIVDYKTSHVPDYWTGGKAAIVEHARRYHLQVGVYAAAVRQMLGDVALDVYIHYIRYNENNDGTIRIPETDWQAAISALENQIGDVLGEIEDEARH